MKSPPSVNSAVKAIWLTGLPCSGKTTLALALEKELKSHSFPCIVLDGDIIRKGLNSDLGFNEADRKENIRRVAEVSKLLNNNGTITLNSFISPARAIREMAKNIIGANNFIEVYVNCPLHICESRDVKGHYAKARRGEIPDFTGVTAGFEPPVSPAIELQTGISSVEECTNKLLTYLLPLITLR